MLGATSVSIDYSATVAQGLQLNARLYDVFPDGSSVMVDRGVRRVESASGTVTYQLHGNGWRFPAGHRVRIEIAQDDDPYLRASTVPSTTTISHVTLRIPVRESTPYARPAGRDAAPGAAGAWRTSRAPRRTASTARRWRSRRATRPSSLRCADGRDSGRERQGGEHGGLRRSACSPAIPSTPADEADVPIDIVINDVRRRSDLADYTGELLVNHSLRITDRFNGTGRERARHDGRLRLPDLPAVHRHRGARDRAPTAH